MVWHIYVHKIENKVEIISLLQENLLELYKFATLTVCRNLVTPHLTKKGNALVYIDLSF